MHQEPTVQFYSLVIGNPNPKSIVPLKLNPTLVARTLTKTLALTTTL